MSDLVKSFNLNRSALARTAEISADKAAEMVLSIRAGVQPDSSDKSQVNRADAFTSFMGLLTKSGGVYQVTPLADKFLELYNQQKADAWRWLVTRSAWLYVVPNGTTAKVNSKARAAGVSFNFFRLILQVLTHLKAQPNKEHYLYYDEFLSVMADDSNWNLTALELTSKVLAIRPSLPVPDDKEGLLGELEDTYILPRDNYNGLFNKLFEQIGLFDYVKNGHKLVGIALSDTLDEVLQRRIRFIIDNPPVWDGVLPWSSYLSSQSPDLPLEVTVAREEPPLITYSADISDLVTDATQALNDAGLHVVPELVRRYLAALFTKPFVVLSGLTGSGKTKLAQLIAQWLDSPMLTLSDAFTVGAVIGTGSATYTVTKVTPSLLEVVNPDGAITPLPLRVIAEWADYIRENHIDIDSVSADEIRKVVKDLSSYANYIHGSSSIIKTLATHLLSYTGKEHRRYEVVPVEANWSSVDDVFGYADALDNNRYLRRPALDLVLSARANYETSDSPLPYFLILDEMNLSHVERYFATILSALESGEAITLHGDKQDREGVPARLLLPPNLFIIGTINVDETTYQFSPKVLDRANVIEFRVSDEQMRGFLKTPTGINSATLAGKGAGYAAACVATAKIAPEPEASEIELLEDELMLFYEALAAQGAEFGFRAAKEVARFTQMHKVLSGGTSNFRAALDAQILQKLLPKLHGSQRKLEPLLRSLAVLCHEGRSWQVDPKPVDADALRAKVVADVQAASDTRKKDFDPLTAKLPGGGLRFTKGGAYLPLSFEKVVRMLERVGRDGFTSFAEA